mmetsp:Transcript_141573/g.440110  ORF Transcript_141573/g.440110 Transcript_141573/m.440110 type:complete len:221 (-) Transcript_141573:94-756(-)
MGRGSAPLRSPPLCRRASFRLSPDVITYNAAISACEKAGQGQHNLVRSAALLQSPTAPGAITYNAAVTAPSRGTGGNCASWENCEGGGGPLPVLVPLDRPRTWDAPQECLQLLLSFRKSSVAWEVYPMEDRKRVSSRCLLSCSLPGYLIVGPCSLGIHAIRRLWREGRIQCNIPSPLFFGTQRWAWMIASVPLTSHVAVPSGFCGKCGIELHCCKCQFNV